MEEKKKRKGVVIVGSDSDLPQCAAGLKYLCNSANQIEIVGVHTLSVHRNTGELFGFLNNLKESPVSHALSSVFPAYGPVDVIIAGAGWAAHLPGMIDSYLRYNQFNCSTVVIGVAFEDPGNDNHNMAARLSISEVPGTRVVFADDRDFYFGSDGFLRACRFAAEGVLPEIRRVEPRLAKYRSLGEVIETFAQNSGEQK